MTMKQKQKQLASFMDIGNMVMNIILDKEENPLSLETEMKTDEQKILRLNKTNKTSEGVFVILMFWFLILCFYLVFNKNLTMLPSFICGSDPTYDIG